MKSDFGRGFVYPLTLFALHFERNTNKFYGTLSETDKRILKNVFNNNKKKWLSHEIESFFNGASDHLYELVIPKKFRKKKIGRLASKLCNKALEIGHGFTGKEWTLKDFEECYEMLKEIMFLLDKELGVKPIKAEYS